MSAGSVTAAMTRTGPAQRGQYLRSISNTRRRRCIQVMGAVGSDSLACSPWPGAGGEDWLSTMWWRCFALAALAHPCASRHRHFHVQCTLRAHGHQYAVVAVTVSARWRDEHGEAVQKLERGELEHVLSVGTGLWQTVVQARALARPRQPLAREHRPGAIARQPFESRAILRLYPNAGIDGKA